MVNREELKNNIINLKFLTQSEQKKTQNVKYPIELINESFELNPEHIKPKLINVDSKHKLWKQWKAIEQNVSSFNFRRSAGRNCYFLVINEYDGKSLGL